MKRAVWGCVLALAVAPVAAPATANDAKPRALIGAFADESPQYWAVRPSAIMLARLQIVGRLDGDGVMRWSRWGARKAIGRGTLWIERCEPTCADGRFQDRGRVRVVLSDPKRGRFQQMRLTGAVRQDLRVAKVAGLWSWQGA